MTLLPIVGRELRVAARRPGTYWFRVAVATVALGAGLIMLLGSSSWRSPSQVGDSVFSAIAVVLLCFALLAGPFATADLLSAERREGTLGLLFLTDLRPYDVALGKLSAATLQTAAALLGTLPLLTLPLLAGGVTGSRIAVTALMLALLLAVSLSVSLACSACTRNGRLALLAAGTVLGLLTLLPWVEILLEGVFFRGTPKVGSWLMLACPPYLAAEAIAEGDLLRPGPGKFWTGVAFQLLLALGSLGVACWRLPRLAMESDAVAAPRRRRPQRPGEVHPFWLAASDRALRRWLFRVTILFTVLFAVLLGAALGKREEGLFFAAIVVAYFQHLLLKCQFAAEATDRFHQDRTSGGLEVLLASPLPVKDCLRDYWRGLRRRFAASRLILIGLNAACALTLIGGQLHPQPRDEAFWWLLGLFGTGVVFIWLDCRALTWAGLRLALRVRTSGRAMLGAVARILLPGWLAMFFWFLALLQDVLSWNQSEIRVSLLIWVGGFAAWDLWRARRDRRWLEQNLRAAAAGEIVTRSVWSRLRRKFLLRNDAKSRE